MDRRSAIHSLLLVACCMVLACVDPLRVGGPHYFMEVVRVRGEGNDAPTHPIDADDVEAREGLGHSYYIAHYDDQGRLVSLKHRMKGRLARHFTYAYPNRRQVRHKVEIDTVEEDRRFQRLKNVD